LYQEQELELYKKFKVEGLTIQDATAAGDALAGPGEVTHGQAEGAELATATALLTGTKPEL
jgi:hypothetical protein